MHDFSSMRYRLRTLLIVLAVGPLIIAAAWYLLGFGNETYRRTLRADSAIRNELLAKTPVGTPASKVLAYVVNEVAHEGEVSAYYNWARAHEASTGTFSVNRTDDRTIEAIVGERSVLPLLVEDVTATWHFDDNDRVSDITVERNGYGP